MSKHQANKPEDITTDYKGDKLEVGKRVAFNYSGEVKLGIIKEIHKNTWKKAREGMGDKFWWYPNFMIEIQHMDSELTSKVKNPTSLACID